MPGMLSISPILDVVIVSGKAVLFCDIVTLLTPASRLPATTEALLTVEPAGRPDGTILQFITVTVSRRPPVIFPATIPIFSTVTGSLLSPVSQTIEQFSNVTSLMIPPFTDLKKRYDYKEVGGTAFLGIKKPVFKTHGSSDARTFYSKIINVSDYVKADVTNEIRKGIEASDGERKKPSI